MKEKKVCQSATKIRIISCTAASCAPFRPRCAHSCRPCAPPARLLVAPFLQGRAPFGQGAPFLPPLRTPNAPSRYAISPRPCAFSPTVHPLPPPLRTPNASPRRAISPRSRALQPRPMRKARGFSPFPPHFPRKVPLFSKKVPTFFSPPRRRARPPRPWRKGQISHRRGKVRRNAHAFTFFYF